MSRIREIGMSRGKPWLKLPDGRDFYGTREEAEAFLKGEASEPVVPVKEPGPVATPPEEAPEEKTEEPTPEEPEEQPEPEPEETPATPEPHAEEPDPFAGKTKKDLQVMLTEKKIKFGSRDSVDDLKKLLREAQS